MSFFDSLNTTSVNSELQNIKNDVASALGIKTALQSKNNTIPLPWSEVGSVVNSKFYPYIKIADLRWNQLFPYRLLVIDTNNQNKVVNGDALSGKTVFGFQEGTAIASFQPLGSQWIFNLPITPQQLNITDQFAINTSATLRGVMEEHNGVKFKMINAAGSMGVWPFRESVSSPPQSPGILNSLFGGSIEAVQGLASQVGKVINTFTSNHPANKPTTVNPRESSSGFGSTGYFNAIFLQQFLEQYAEAKKNPKNSGWRLIFDIPKQNQSFIVTPMQYTWQQTANKPMEIMYSFQLKAWRRIDLQQIPSVQPANAYTLTPGILQRILNTITEARLVCSSAIALIGAVRSDVDNIFSILSQTALFTKDLLGIAPAASDLGPAIVKDFQSSIQQFVSSNSTTITAAVTSAATIGAIAAIAASTKSREGITQNAASNGQLGNQAANQQSINNSNDIFGNPNKFAELMDQVPTTSLVLNTSQQNKLNQIVNNSSSLTVDQLNSFASTLLSLALQLSNHFGAGDSYYDMVYSRPAPTPRSQPMTLSESTILKALYDAIQSYYIMTATTQVNDLQIQSSLDYVAGLANQAGISFTTPSTKILAPVPLGLTMEGISARYLGNPERWLEIAVLNNLREPYIDENGFTYNLLSNAIGRQIVIGSNENLFLGQVVTIKSNTQLPTSRKILGISRISDTSFLLTLDGAPNLGNFLLADGAYLQAYLPGTVNSQNKIFIPSDLPSPTNDNLTIIPPNVAAKDPLTGISKVDLLLTDTGDLAVNDFGDFRFSYGLTNIIQSLKIKLGSIKGTLLTHPEFGLGVKVGTSSADIDLQNLYNSINKTIQEDPRFTGVDTLQISLNGPVLSINLNVRVAGQTGVFPISFKLDN